MVDIAPAPSPAEATPRRQARQRRKRRSRVLIAVVAALVVAAGALVATGSLSAGSDSGASTASAVATPDDSVPAAPAGSRPHRRALTPADPLRLWIAGDSLAGSLGPSLGELTAATGVVQPQYDSRVSSGLVNTSFFDWPEHATEQLAQLDPEAVVFIIGTNDANIWDDADSQQYAQLTESMMRMLAANGRDVYWVNAPVMKADTLEENVKKVDEIQRQAATRVDGVTYIDAHTLFADASGEYQSGLVDALGKKTTMRAGDGIHFSPDGGDYLAAAVYRAMDARWRITAQKVDGQAKDVRVTKGSTRVGGTYRQPGTSSNGSSSSGQSSTYRTTTTRSYSATSPTTTSPPATSPTTSPPPSTTPTTTSPPSTTPTTASTTPSG